MTYVNNASFQSAVSASRNASDASEVFNKSKKATAAVPEPDSAPTDGKSIPIIVGAVKLTGSVIWIRTYRNSKNECLCDVAICFGRNAFGRSIGLVSLQQGGNYIYRRSKGKTIDPPKTVRFYDGTQTEADPTIKHHEGESKTPAFKGYIYAVLLGVKLGDITAEFTDTTDDPTTTYTETCDPALAGIDLVYNPYNGRYYGLLAPMSGQSSIIISDGCKILHKVKIHGIFNKEYLAGDPSTKNFYCDKIYPLACSDMVVITGTASVGERANWEHWHFDGAVSYSPIFNPYTGKPVGGKNANSDSLFIYPWFPRNGLGPFAYGDEAEGWGIDWKVSYRLPGSHGRMAYLRTYVKETAFALSEYFLPIMYWPYSDQAAPELASGNIACQIVNERTGEMDYWYQDVGRCRTNVDDARPRIDDWNVRDFPEVTDFMLCKTNPTNVILGGYVELSHAFTIHVIQHSQSGIDVLHTVNVTLPNATWTPGSMNYDAKSETILVDASSTEDFVSPRVYKISLSGAVSFISMSDGYTRMMSNSEGLAGNGAAPVTNADGSQIGKIDLETGDTKTIYSGSVPSSPPVVDLNKQTFSIPTVSGITRGITDEVGIADIPLTSLIGDCCAIKGYQWEDLQFQNLEEVTLLGLLINSTIRMSDLLNRLGSVFGFTFVETDRKLKFLKKRNESGISVDIELEKDDLVRPENGDSPVRTIERASAGNLLGGMDFEYMNPEKQYENDTIKIRRPNGSFDVGSSTRIETISVPVTLDPDDAYALMYEAFYSLIQKETRVAFSVMPWMARIEPGDCIRVVVDGVENTGVAVRVTTREDFAQDIEMESYLDNGTTVFTSSAGTGGDDGTVVPDKVYGEYIPIDIPYLRATDASGPTRVMQYGLLTTRDAPEWSGADLYRSSDGSSFTKIVEYDAAPATVGRAVNVLEQPAEPFVTDTVSVLVLTVDAGDPADFVNQTYLEQMNGSVIAAYGRSGAWELISWREVVQNSDGEIELYNLQRGLFGTHMVFESVESFGEGLTHETGDLICILDPAKVIRMMRDFAEVGADERYGVVTNSVGLDAADKASIVLSGRGNRIPPIAGLRAFHASGSSEMDIRWEQQSQIAASWQDSGPLNPPLEPISYVVVIHGVSEYYAFETTETSYKWTGYGADSSPDTNAEEYGMTVEVYPVSATYPYVGDIDFIRSERSPAMVASVREI